MMPKLPHFWHAWTTPGTLEHLDQSCLRRDHARVCCAHPIGGYSTGGSRWVFDQQAALLLQEAACDATALRSLNLAFSAACLGLLCALHRRLHPTCSAGRSLGTVSVWHASATWWQFVEVPAALQSIPDHLLGAADCILCVFVAECAVTLLMVQAVALSLFPLHFFFQFLYYTDVASVTAVIAAHLVCCQSHQI